MPHQELVICGHGMICQKEQPLPTRKHVDILEITDSAVGVAGFQVAVELRVARAGIVTAIAERPVNTNHAGCVQDSGDAAEQILHRIPTHDVECVGREHGVDALDFPGVFAHIELDGLTQIGWPIRGWPIRGWPIPGWPVPRDALSQSRQILTLVAGLPRQVRKVSREMHRVLTGATADLQDGAAARESFREDP